MMLGPFLLLRPPQSGASLKQLLSACHWKSNKTVTKFYLMDMAQADSELFHLSPVVAAKQINTSPYI